MIPDEGQTVERKESLGERREIAETCAAFASAQGGRIYIGVRDELIGVLNAPKRTLQRDLRELTTKGLLVRHGTRKATWYEAAK